MSVTAVEGRVLQSTSTPSIVEALVVPSVSTASVVALTVVLSSVAVVWSAVTAHPLSSSADAMVSVAMLVPRFMVSPPAVLRR